jgi:hypothetical protein
MPVSSTLSSLPNSPRPAVLHLLLALAAIVSTPVSAAAQQFLTDDAAVVGFAACQIEAWYGQRESRIEPACQAVRNLEIMVGFGYADDGADRVYEPAIEAKYLLRETGSRAIGVSAVVGLLFDGHPFSRDRMEELFGYIPMTVPVAADRLYLHLNAGGRLDLRDAGNDAPDEARAMKPFWAARADLTLPMAADRFDLIADFSAEETRLPEYQIGLRGRAIPDLLLIDLSWGGHLESGVTGAGWKLGIGWTPGRIF